MSFREFEHSGWERLPQQYDRAFGRLTVQAIPALLDAVSLKKGMRLLDVATGPGYVAGAAAERGADVLGIDFASAMVDSARQLRPELQFEQGDAEALAFRDGSFDAVTMNFGLLHLGRPERALAEARRVLRPRGRFAFTVWAKPEQARGFGIVLAAIQRHGDLSAPVPAGPSFFRFSDAGECQRTLQQAGFRAPQFTTVPQTWWLDSPADLFEFMLGSTVRTGALLRAQTPEALDAIRKEVEEGALTHRRAETGKIAIPMPAIVASATSP